ncbi:hypothetical protein PF050_20475 [Kosakonia pseudosacchari]|uniref:hypothetical protein n=1 Tax=Kosakonia pseudosacchari TaxID=1646340 RepID=UPI0022F0392B|nr:hypothetical protein [Kosakonia pseudosacchari]WBU48804.1 hypothetical protein PF050_20475 [Kosakonia pseudosacchari]
MIDEKEAIESAKAYALKNFINCWDYDIHLAALVELDGVQYWEINTNLASPPGTPFYEHILPSPIRYYVDPETGKCVGFKNHRSKCIQNPGG